MYAAMAAWVAAMGAGPGGSSEWLFDYAHIRHLVLPALTLSVIPLGIITRTVRALVADILSQPTDSGH